MLLVPSKHLNDVEVAECAVLSRFMLDGLGNELREGVQVPFTEAALNVWKDKERLSTRSLCELAQAIEVRSTLRVLLPRAPNSAELGPPRAFVYTDHVLVDVHR